MNQPNLSDNFNSANSTNFPFAVFDDPSLQIKASQWSFMLGGLVDIPLILAYHDLLAYPSATLECHTLCAGSPYSQSLPETNHWRGVWMNQLLDEVSVQSDVEHAHLFASDGYSTSIELSVLQLALLAYGLNDQPLTPGSGHPVRLIAPSLYGYKMPKSIQRIILADQPLAGTWETRGWPLNGEIAPTATIHLPKNHAVVSTPVRFSGAATAGQHPVTSVEISIDDSPWMPVPVSQTTPHRWAHWQIDWVPPVPGTYIVRARASSPLPLERQPFDNPAVSHSIVIHVEE